MGNAALKTLIFLMDGHKYGLFVSVVDRVIPVVEARRLPGAPLIVLGVINVQGRVLPVLDIRKRFGLPEREIRLSDHCIIARSSRRTAALLVDSVEGVLSFSESQLIQSEAILPQLEYVAGAIKLSDGIILVHDLDRFLSLDEDQALEEALQREGVLA